ncbi:dienelactone hydrolase family protein [Desulforhopalus singaporensis]|uniref:Dienelactone hydrolase n=1 Tax=Desulforhopalus singaporensis TaxID=91360 RepID=A0A1H0LXG1_9BACT|nr:dienelactone hydrolase family protein [Desulforhopalus singaporensis]SDO72825.1 Dienelactone hydrolase [Desulforhopalus singaporensis]
MKYIISFLLTLTAATCLAGQSVSYTVGTMTYEGYMEQAGENAPLVLLLHDWDGLTDYEVKRAGMLAKHGYNVFAADLFGAGVRPVTVEKKRQLTKELYQDREKMRTLINGAMVAAGDEGLYRDNNAVAIGYCFGGAAVLEYARSGADLKGFVTFHGTLATPPGQNYEKAKGSYLILHGTADQSVTMEQFAELADQLEQNDLDHEMISYGGAPHAFTVFGSERYHKDADRKSWQRLLQFLSETL